MGRFKFSLLLFLLILLSYTSEAYADVFVNGYFRNGKYITPHYRSNPDGYFLNNWSTYGNVNPYTGEFGTKRYPSNSYYTPFMYDPFSFYGTDESEDFYENSTDYKDSTDTEELEAFESINYADDFINSYDTKSEKAAKKLLVDYFNDINIRDYVKAYNYWSTEWKDFHTYEWFENGYVDVINTVNDLNSVKTDEEIILKGTISTKEGWDQSEHQYDFKYWVEKVNGDWKLTAGILEKLW